MKVKFLPTGKEVEITPEKTLLQAAIEGGVEIRSICKGKLNCAECRVKIVDGESNLLPPSKAELNLLGLAWQIDSRRYSCQVRCFGDVTVDLTEQIERANDAKKNIRGFKSSKPVTESHAVIDTLILAEKIETPAQPDRPPRESQGEERQGGEQRQRGEHKQGGGRDQGRAPGEPRPPGQGQRRGRRGGRGRNKS